MKKLIILLVLIITALVPITGRVSKHKGYVEGCMESVTDILIVLADRGIDGNVKGILKEWCEKEWSSK